MPRFVAVFRPLRCFCSGRGKDNKQSVTVQSIPEHAIDSFKTDIVNHSWSPVLNEGMSVRHVSLRKALCTFMSCTRNMGTFKENGEALGHPGILRNDNTLKRENWHFIYFCTHTPGILE